MTTGGALSPRFSMRAVPVTEATLTPEALAAIMKLDVAWRDSDTRDPSHVAGRLVGEDAKRRGASVCAFVGFEGSVWGYAEHAVVADDVHVLWFCAPRVGKIAMRCMLEYFTARYPEAKTTSLCVSIDSEDPPKRVAARLNLYIGTGKYRVIDTTSFSDGSTSLYLARKLKARTTRPSPE